jgi:hypothetical protein
MKELTLSNRWMYFRAADIELFDLKVNLGLFLGREFLIALKFGMVQAGA